MGIVMEPKRTVGSDTTQVWRVNGRCHRLDGPAVIGADGTQEWWVNGQLHRLDGPAIIYPDGYQEWYVSGQLHREDGPAVIRAAGTQEWWVRDQNITTQVAAWMQTQSVAWPWDDPTQMQFVLTFG
jgi:hypothetical protein